MQMTIPVRINIVSAMAALAGDDVLSTKTAQVTDLCFALLAAGGEQGIIVEQLSNLAGELERAMIRRGFRPSEIPMVVRRELERAGQPIPVASPRIRRPGVGL